MTTLDAATVEKPSAFVAEARRWLSGKRVALVGLPSVAMDDYAQLIGDADGFTRLISPLKVKPDSEVLRPFELIVVDGEAAAGTDWLEPVKLDCVKERCLAVAPTEMLFQILADGKLVFRECWSNAAPSEEILLRCVLSLRSDPGQTRKVAAGATVVLADDDSSVTSIVRRALERNGLQCEIAASGRDALDLITRVKPCAAILDVHMPAIDGFQVLSQMKSLAELAQIRVILLTGCEQEEDIIRGFSLGADDYVCKPFNPMELTIRLMRVLGRI